MKSLTPLVIYKLIKTMDKRRKVQVVYHDCSLTVSWNPHKVTTDTAIESINKLGMRLVEYFKGSTLYFIVKTQTELDQTLC